MSSFYDDFEKRFTDKWFSAGWVEAETKGVELKEQSLQPARKDLAILKSELDEIQERIENIAQKQLRLANLAQLYEN